MSNKNAFTEIYEYQSQYWVIEKSYQFWPEENGPTERVALAGVLPVDCSSEELGKLCLNALKNFNSKEPPYQPWELKELRKLFCSWVGAKSWNSFYKNSRYIWVAQFDNHRVKMIPVDNCNLYPHESGIETSSIEMNDSIESEKLGKAIVDVFKYATYHPERKVK